MKHGVRMCLQYGISRLEKDLEKNEQRIQMMRIELAGMGIRSTEDWFRMKSGISVAEQLSKRLRQYILEAKDELNEARSDEERSVI